VLRVFYSLALGVFAMTSSHATSVALCGDKPNCVSSAETRDAWRIEPLLPRANESVQDLWQRLQDLLRQEEAQTARVPWTLSSGDAPVIDAVFVTKWLRFKDDVQFRLDTKKGVIQWRSSSRIGHSDLGANRKRLESLRQQLSISP
jgi:uncharacterized protein (DUF1499 family)